MAESPAQSYVQKLLDLKDQPLNKSSRLELRIYKLQDKFRIEREELEKEYAEKSKQMNNAYEESIAKHEVEFLSTLLGKMQIQEIREIRRTTVPAYTFDNFRLLPSELQLKIWRMAIPPKKPRTYRIAIGQGPNPNSSDMHQSSLIGSSHVRLGKHKKPYYPALNLLHACHDSREESLKGYTMLPCSKKMQFLDVRKFYFDTTNDTFYLGGHVWFAIKLLVDLVIKVHSSRALRTKIQEDLNAMLAITLLLVDFRVFIAAPSRIWAEFKDLKKLTIMFLPSQYINGDEYGGDDVKEDIVYAKPRLGTALGSRKVWTIGKVKARLEEAKLSSGLADWNLPQVDAVVQRTGTVDDYCIIEEQNPDEERKHETAARETDLFYDGGWYQDVEDLEAISPRLEEHVLKFKNRYHPGRRVGNAPPQLKSRRHRRRDLDIDWLSDSESEKQHPDRAFIYEDEEW